MSLRLVFYHSVFVLHTSSALSVSNIGPCGPATPMLELPLTALYYCLIIRGLSYEYCAIPNSFSLVSIIFQILDLSSFIALLLLDMSVFSENLFLVSKVPPPTQSPLTLYCWFILKPDCVKNSKRASQCPCKSGSYQPASLMLGFYSLCDGFLIVAPFLSQNTIQNVQLGT